MGKFHTQPYKNGRTRERARQYYYPYKGKEYIPDKSFELISWIKDKLKIKKWGRV